MSEGAGEQNRGCPDDLTLRRVVEAGRPAEEAASVREHLERCEACQSRLDGLFDAPQEFAALRGALGQAAPAEPEGAYRRGRGVSLGWSVCGEQIELGEGLRLPRPRSGRYLARLGDYDVISVLGRGGMGYVLKGFDEVLQRYVALKIIKPSLAVDPVARERFLREARAAARIDHPNVVRIYGAKTDEEPAFLAMQYVPGKSLSSLIATEAPLAMVRAARIAVDVLEALRCAHAEGLIHRDVKPANVLVDQGTKTAKVADFGLVRGIGDVMRRTEEGTVMGTPCYMSPEQTVGAHRLDGRSDLFSLGIVLFEMLTGLLPFPGEDQRRIMADIRDAPTPDPRTYNPTVSQRFADVVARALQKDPDDRFQSAAEFIEALRGLLAGSEQTTVSVSQGGRPPASERTPGSVAAGGTCQFPGCGSALRAEEAFVCGRCRGRMCVRHRDRELPACCTHCAEEVRGNAFDRRIEELSLDSEVKEILAHLSEISQAQPAFHARIWTERGRVGEPLSTRDVLTVPRSAKAIYYVGEQFTLHAQAQRDCHLTVLDVGTSGRVYVLLRNHPLRAGIAAALGGPDQHREWIVGGPPGVERIKALFTCRPLALPGPSEPFQPLVPQGMARDVLTRLKSVGTTLDRMPADSWTEATCQFIVET